MEVETKFGEFIAARKADEERLAFGIMFDMWESKTGSKEIGVFLVKAGQVTNESKVFLLCLTPLLDDTTSNGASQIETISIALDAVNLNWDDIAFIVADNTSVNPSIARRVDNPLVGCKSHVFALVVNEFLQLYQRSNETEAPLALDKLNTLSVCLRK